MGTISSINRSARFIAEFRDDARRMYAPGEEGRRVFTSWDIQFDESDELVRLYWTGTFDGLERHLTSDSFPVFFDPDEPDEDLIERVMDLFELDRATATPRLRKADLLHDAHITGADA